MSVRARLVTLGAAAFAVPLMAIGLASNAQADTTLGKPPPPKPAPPVVPAALRNALPVALDVRTPDEAQLSCDPRAKPGVVAFAALLKATYATGTTVSTRAGAADVT